MLAFQSNSNNAWIFNGTNGNLNNGNNRINAYAARLFRASALEVMDVFMRALIPLPIIYRWFRKTIARKRRKCSMVEYNRQGPRHLREMCLRLNGRYYIPSDYTWFPIFYPKLREVIAPDADDRTPQTLWCETVRPYVEKHLDPNSYSCRVGRGALRAVDQFIEYYFEESEGGTVPCDFISIDQKSFFLHLDRRMLMKLYEPIIRDNFEPQMADFLIWLGNILYLSCPAEHLNRICPVSEAADLPDYKRMEKLPWWQGVAIGNLPSQMAGNIASTLYLNILRYYGFTRFVHYSDDIRAVIRHDRLQQFLRIVMPTLRREESRYNMEMNEGKFYCQPSYYGVKMFGYFLKTKGSEIILVPDRRIIRNFSSKLSYYEFRGQSKRWRLWNKEHFRDCVNSYLGIFRHCQSADLRAEIAARIQHGPWNDMIRLKPGNTACAIRKAYTRKEYYRRRNRELRRYINQQIPS